MPIFFTDHANYAKRHKMEQQNHIHISNVRMYIKNDTYK